MQLAKILADAVQNTPPLNELRGWEEQELEVQLLEVDQDLVRVGRLPQGRIAELLSFVDIASGMSSAFAWVADWRSVPQHPHRQHRAAARCTM